MGPSATTLMIRRSSVPCGRSNFSPVFFMPNSSTYTLGCVEGQGVCFGVYGVRPQSRVDPQTETASSGCCVHAITERNSRTAKCGIFEHGCRQAEALIQSFSLIDVISKWIVNWLVGN